MAEAKLNQLGLAEFVAGLISETFEAISVSMESQLMRQAELVRAAELDPEEYAAKHITEDAVDQACMELFGAVDNTTLIVRGGAYIPGKGDDENPPIKRQLGIELETPADFQKMNNGYQLTEQGAARIRKEIRLQAAQFHQETLRLVLNKGLPRILIDSGRILSKVTFNVTESESEATPPAAVSAAGNLKTAEINNIAAFKTNLINRLGITRKNLLLPNTQLKVKPAADDKSQTSTTNVYGEVEISFKTVT
jgi:hypothetical protein